MFTVSVGNLPPGASVLIKITYVAELSVEGDHIVFRLPGSVAPWKQDTALDQTTQTTVEKIKVKKQRSVLSCLSVSLSVSVCLSVCLSICLSVFLSVYL